MYFGVDTQSRHYRVDFACLAQVRAVLDDVWGDALERLQAVAEREEAAARAGDPWVRRAARRAGRSR